MVYISHLPDLEPKLSGGERKVDTIEYMPSSKASHLVILGAHASKTSFLMTPLNYQPKSSVLQVLAFSQKLGLRLASTHCLLSVDQAFP